MSRRLTVTCLAAVALSALAPSDAAWLTSAVGFGTSLSTVVGPGSSPAPVASGRTVSLTWPAAALDSGATVTTYLVRRYDAAGTTQPISSGTCATVVSTTSCTHSAVPPGSWRYAITPTQGQWRGSESPPSAGVSVAAPALALSTPTAVRPGTVLSGSLSGFVAGETLSYRLDSTSGPVLTGKLGAASTPTAVPTGGAGTVTVTVPAGTSDGLHPVLAIAAPSAESAAHSIVVDGTPPPAPVFTSTPASPSGEAVSFAFSEADLTAVLECRLDSDPYGPCASPVAEEGLTAGAHTFSVRATDLAGNVSPVSAFSWSVDTNLPVVEVDVPSVDARVNDASFDAGCGTPTGDVCGSADDATGITSVAVSLRRVANGSYWNGSAFVAGAESFRPATGTDAWSYAIPASSLPAEGDYVLRVRATDGGGAFGYDSRTFTVDRTPPPAPTFTLSPPATSGPTVSLAYSTADATAGFECRLDAGPWATCTTPQTLTGLADGPHTAAVRAVDPAGNTSAPTSVSWSVDAVAPTASAVFPATGPYTAAAWTAGCSTPATDDVCGFSSDAGSGVASVSVSVRRESTGLYYGGSGFTASSETWLAATGTGRWTYPLAASALPDGAYTLRFRALDGAGNATTGSKVFVLDTTPPPQPALTTAPASPGGTSADFGFSVPETGATVECRLDAGTWTPCTSPTTYSGLVAGSHTVALRARDAAGNLSVERSHTWVVDPDLPTVVVTGPASGTYRNATFDAACGTPAGDVCGSASDPQGVVRVDVSLRRDETGLYWNGTAFAAGVETWVRATGTTSWSLPFAATSFPAEGAYTVRARVTDVAGSTATDSVVVTMDRTAPAAPTITSGPSGTTNGTDVLTFTAEAGASFTCQKDTGPVGPCTSPFPTTSANGSHTFTVRAVDVAGNTGAPASRTWTVDTVAPAVAITFAADSGTYSAASFTTGCGTTGAGDVCGTATDAGGTVASAEVTLRRASTGLYWDGAGFTAAGPVWLPATGSSTWSLGIDATAFPADGTYVLTARATDAVGNLSAPVTSTFTMDRAGPVATPVDAVDKGTTVRRIETGDQLVLTFSEAIAPSSLIAGWNGAGSQSITIRQLNNTNDALTFYNAANTARLPLGTVQLKRTDYVTGAVTWGGPTAPVPATVALSGSSLTVTFGTPNVAASVTTAAATANINWTPRASVPAGTGITDLVGNLGTATARPETDNDGDF